MVPPSGERELRAMRIRAAEAERRLRIYARRLWAVERKVKLAPGQASEGLDVARELKMENVAELKEFVEELFAKLATFEGRLRAAEEGRAPPTKNLPAVSRRSQSETETPESGKKSQNSETETLDETKPWVAAGVSKATWYRNLKKPREDPGG
jgi:hypothetical protein